MSNTRWHYFRVGMVERWRWPGRGNPWREAYSRPTKFGCEYPWSTVCEALAEARAAGARAVFHGTRDEAIAAEGVAR